MPAWEERIDRSTSLPLVVEHVARYRFALPVIRRSARWVDLGCGNGLAAGEATEGAFDGELVLVDRDGEALSEARELFVARNPDTVQLDLGSEEGVAKARERLLAPAADGSACITSFGLLEELEEFEPLVDLLVALATEATYTVVLSVPNDAFWSLQDPYHRTMWGGEAFEEFRSVLPRDHVVAYQHPLVGTCVKPLGGDWDSRELSVEVSDEGVPSHYLVAFGPLSGTLTAVGAVVREDLDERRAIERRREADLSFLQQRVADLEFYESEVERLHAERQPAEPPERE
jgi:SAM-dependent methyltransferase